MMKQVERVFHITPHTQGQTGGQLLCLQLWDLLFKLSFSYFSQQN